jgi:hypothetical protein
MANGKIRVDEIRNKAGTGAPQFPNGIKVTNLTDLAGTGAPQFPNGIKVTNLTDLAGTGAPLINGASPVIKWQRKYLTAPAPYSLGGTILSFNNLEIGKTYRLTGKVCVDLSNNALYSGLFLRYMHGTTRLHTSIYAGRTSTNDPKVYTDAIDFIFTATTTTVSVVYGRRFSDAEYVLHDMTEFGQSVGNTTTYLQLEEIPLHQQVTLWT